MNRLVAPPDSSYCRSPAHVEISPETLLRGLAEYFRYSGAESVSPDWVSTKVHLPARPSGFFSHSHSLGWDSDIIADFPQVERHLHLFQIEAEVIPPLRGGGGVLLLSPVQIEHLKGYRILQALCELTVSGYWDYDARGFSLDLGCPYGVQTISAQVRKYLSGTPTFLGTSPLSENLLGLLREFRVSRTRVGVEAEPREFVEMSFAEIAY